MDNKVKIGIGVAIGIAILFFAVTAVVNHQKYQANIVTHVDANLSAEARQLYEQRRDDAKKLISEINDQTSVDDKFNRYVALANAEFSLGNYAEAKKWFLVALDTDPNHDGIWQVYSTLLLAMQDQKASLRAIDKAISINSANSDYWRWKAEIIKKHYYDQNRLDNLYIEALDKTKNSINIITAYAQFLEDIGNLQGARDYWQKAIDLYPTNRVGYEAEIRRIDQKLQAK